MKKLMFYISCTMILLTSCDDELPSLHPIVNETEALTLKNIEGHWIEASENDGSSILSPIVEWTIDISSDNPTENIDSLREVLETEMKSSEGLLPELRIEFVQAANLSWHNDPDDDLENTHPTDVTFDFNYQRVPRNYRRDIPKELDNLNNVEVKTTFETELLNFYFLRVIQNETDQPPTLTKVMVTKIDDMYFLDFMPTKGEDFSDITLFAHNFIAGHSFARMEIVDSKIIKVRTFDTSYISELIKERRVRLKHELISERDEEKIIITASTNELRAFISKYGHDEKLYEDEITFVKYREIQ